MLGVWRQILRAVFSLSWWWCLLAMPVTGQPKWQVVVKRC